MRFEGPPEFFAQALAIEQGLVGSDHLGSFSAGFLEEFDTKAAALRERLTKTTDAEMMAPWTLKHGAHEIFTMPRISTFRSFVMNHLIHHRGQLSVYLRLKDVPLPPMYGPTADEQ